MLVLGPGLSRVRFGQVTKSHLDFVDHHTLMILIGNHDVVEFKVFLSLSGVIVRIQLCKSPKATII